MHGQVAAGVGGRISEQMWELRRAQLQEKLGSINADTIRGKGARVQLRECGFAHSILDESSNQQ